MGFPEIVLAVGTVLLAAGAVLLRTRWKAPAEVLVWVALAALFISSACAVFLFRSLPPVTGAAFLGLAVGTGVALLGLRKGAAAALLALLAAFVAVTWNGVVDPAGDLLLPPGGLMLVLLGIVLLWTRGIEGGLLLAGGGFLLAVLRSIAAPFSGSPEELAGLGALAAGAFALARLEPRLHGIAWVAGGMVLPLLKVWTLATDNGSPAIVLTGGAMLAAAAYGTGWGAVRSAHWTALSALTGVMSLVLGMFRSWETQLWWSGLALAGAVFYTGTALLTARRRSLAAAAPLAAAAAMLCAFAVTLEIERAWFEVGLAPAVPLLVWLFPKLPSAPLRSLTLGLATFSVLWLGLSWKDFGFPDGGLVDFPWLLYGYGVPLVAMLVGIGLARRQGEIRVANRLEWAALGFLLLLVLFSVRQVYPEKGTAVLVWLAVGIVLAFGIYRAFRGTRGGKPHAATAAVLFFATFLGAVPLSGTEPALPEWVEPVSTWRIQAPGARPGDPVRLDIPDSLYIDLIDSDLHVAAMGLEIQNEIEFPSPEVPAVRLQGARPQPGPQPGVSRIALPFPIGLPLTSIHLETSSASVPFARQVWLMTEDGAAPAGFNWICQPQPFRPCRLDADFRSLLWWKAKEASKSGKNPRLFLAFLDGENPPLPPLDVEIRRRDESLVFLWPEEEPVHLVVGSRRGEPHWITTRETPERPRRPAYLEGAGEDRAGKVRRSSVPAFLLSGTVLLGLLGWRVRERLSRPRALPMVLLMILAGTSGLSAAEGRLYTRPVDVRAKGWVRVPLDLTTLAHLGAEGEGVRVFGPDGQEVLSRMETFDEQRFPISATIKTERFPISAMALVLGRDRRDFIVGVDQGEGPVSYDQIFLSSGTHDHGAASGVRVEGSDDGQSWSPLGVSDLFEIWRDEGWRPSDRQGSMLLPSSPYRFLRLAPPYGFDWAEVTSLPGRTSFWNVERPECRREVDLTVCAIPLPARGQRPLRLALELADRRDLGLRLVAAEEGAWKPLAEGVSRPASGGTRHAVPLRVDRSLETRTLRLELQTKGEPLRLVRAILTLAQPVAVFEAPGPGRYDLRYGGGAGLEIKTRYVGKGGIDFELSGGAPPDAAWIEPGPETSRGMPPLPGRLIRPAVFLTGDFGSSWTVESRGTSPGEVVRVEIPEEVYARSRPDLADVRLEVGGRQIPYLRRSLDEPARVVEVRRARLKERFLGERRLDVPLPQPRLPLTTYRLTASPDSKEFREWPSLSLVPADWRPGWHCYPQPLLPCQLNGQGKSEEGRTFESVVTIEDLPIPSFDVSLWRRRDALVFVWPERGPVRLVTGDREREAPSYDLALIESQILARPWRPASLDSRDASVSWLRMPLVALAGGALLVFLRKKLPIAPPPGQG